MKLAHKLRILPMLIGVLLTFYYLTHWAGTSLPYQDPTPELLAKQATDLKNAELMIFVGLFIIIIGIIYFIWILHFFKKSK